MQSSLRRKRVQEMAKVKLKTKRLKTPTTDVEALKFLLDNRAIPVWDPTNTKGNVHFRRLYLKDEKEELKKRYPGQDVSPPPNIAREEDRKRIVELLGIKSEKGCEEIIKKLRNLGL
jgi:hypothetical protein